MYISKGFIIGNEKVTLRIETQHMGVRVSFDPYMKLPREIREWLVIACHNATGIFSSKYGNCFKVNDNGPKRIIEMDMADGSKVGFEVEKKLDGILIAVSVDSWVRNTTINRDAAIRFIFDVMYNDLHNEDKVDVIERTIAV